MSSIEIVINHTTATACKMEKSEDNLNIMEYQDTKRIDCWNDVIID